jgi:hypothetical protein
MFQLDDKFLQDIGLGAMPDDQKQAFLQHIYSELELRVGTKLSEGLSDEQMSEFESFIDRDAGKVEQWFSAHLPNYAEQPDYQQMKTGAPESASDLDIMCEYGSLKWLELNRPDYRQVVATELEQLKQEIMQNKEAILGAV